MGEKIKDLGQIRLGKSAFTVELNNPESPEKEIHIQNQSFRLALGERAFCKMAADILLARKQLMIIKGLDNEAGRE